MFEAKHQRQLVKAQQQETTIIGIKDNALLCRKTDMRISGTCRR